MTIDAQCQAILDRAAENASPFDGGYEEARALYAAATELYRHDTGELSAIEDSSFDGPAGPVPVRIYRPKPRIVSITDPVQGEATVEETPGAVLFFHGGGWVIGDIDTHDHMCRYLAHKADVVVVSVHYRLAPEAPFPAAFDDCLAAARWLVEDAAALAIDPARWAIAGDSAGGNLAAAVTIALRDQREPMPNLQLLMYPAVDATADNESLRVNGEGYLLTAAAMDKFVGWYLPDEGLREDPRVSPQLAEHHTDLPRAWVQTAEFDPLRDEGLAYAQTLAKAGVEVEYKCYPGMIHGFMRMGAVVDMAISALDDAAQALRSALAR
jgi:acetyl esterase